MRSRVYVATNVGHWGRRFDDTVRQKWNPGGGQRKVFLAQLGKVTALRPLVPDGSTMGPTTGMKTCEQARVNVAAADCEIDPKTLEAVDRICTPGVQAASLSAGVGCVALGPRPPVGEPAIVPLGRTASAR